MEVILKEKLVRFMHKKKLKTLTVALPKAKGC